MKKGEALARFWEKNGIDESRISNKYNEEYDPRLAQLSERVDQWLETMDEADHALFLTLLSEFTYLTPAQCRLRYDRILDLLLARLGRTQRDFSDILFVTMESAGGRMSGSDNVRADLSRHNYGDLEKAQIIAQYTKITAAEVAQYNTIVFLDDVVGSGETLWGVMRDFCGRFHLNGETSPQLFYACIAPRKHGAARLRKSCNAAHIQASPIWEDAWIVEPAFEVQGEAYCRAEKYERQVGDYLMEPPESFFMGYEKNRLLLAFYYNTPNNTLSTFWRSTPEWTSPPFSRDGNQPKRPSIDQLKKAKKHSREGAYAYGRDHREKWYNESDA